MCKGLMGIEEPREEEEREKSPPKEREAQISQETPEEQGVPRPGNSGHP